MSNIHFTFSKDKLDEMLKAEFERGYKAGYQEGAKKRETLSKNVTTADFTINGKRAVFRATGAENE